MCDNSNKKENDKFDNCFKYYEKAIEGRNFHYQNYNTWVNYYSIFNGALFVGYYSLLEKLNASGHSLILFVITLLGFISALCWHLTVKGHYIWMISWINVVHDYEEELNKISEEDKKYCVYNVYTKPKEGFFKQNISTQKLTSLFTFLVSIVWSFILCFNLENLEFLSNYNVLRYFIYFISICVIYILFFFLFPIKSDVSSMKTSIKGFKNLKVDRELERSFKIFCRKKFKDSNVKSCFRKNSPYINVSSYYKYDNTLHYEYIDGNLRFDNELLDVNDRKKLKNYLQNTKFFEKNKLVFNDEIYGQICVLMKNIYSEQELFRYLKYYKKKIDKLLKKYYKEELCINKLYLFFLCMGVSSAYNNLQNFLTKIFELVNDEKNNLKEIMDKEKSLSENFDFDDSKLCEFNFLSENIYNCLAVFLYSFTEKSFKKLLCSDLDKSLNINDIKKQFKLTHNLTITILNEYESFNELRLVNNCIKHSGFVDRKLSQCNNKWIKDESIVLTEDDIKFYFNSLVDFITDIFSKIIETGNLVIFHID